MKLNILPANDIQLLMTEVFFPQLLLIFNLYYHSTVTAQIIDPIPKVSEVIYECAPKSVTASFAGFNLGMSRARVTV